MASSPHAVRPAYPDDSAPPATVLDEVFRPLLAAYAAAVRGRDLEELIRLGRRLDAATARLRSGSAPAATGGEPRGRGEQAAAAAVAGLAELWRDIMRAHVEQLQAGATCPSATRA